MQAFQAGGLWLVGGWFSVLNMACVGYWQDQVPLPQVQQPEKDCLGIFRHQNIAYDRGGLLDSKKMFTCGAR